ATGAQGYRWNGSTWDDLGYGLGYCFGPYVSLTDDVGISTILEPNTGPDLGLEQVTVRVYNYGTAPQSNIPVYYTVNGGLPNFELIPGPINAGDFIDYTFATLADLSAYGLYDIESCTNLSGDIDPTNDCAFKMVENLQPSLCNPVYTAGCSFGDGFTYFDIDNQYNNVTGCDDNAGTGWSQYLGMNATLETDIPYTLTAATGYSNQDFAVWIDFNDDDIFDPSEQIIVCENMPTAGQNFTYTITIPAGSQPGTHFLRARAGWQPTDPCPIDACASMTYGEAEDYMVTILAGTTGTLEGFVYEFGTTNPIVGANIEIVGAGLNTVSDNTGFYSFLDITQGTYDITSTHPDYCATNLYGVAVIAGNTTIQNIELTWAEIITDPVQEISATLPGNTVFPTQLEIANPASCDLDFDITVTGLTDGVPGKMEGFFDRELMLEVAVKPDLSNQTDELDPNAIGPGEIVLPMIKKFGDNYDGEEVFGSFNSSWTGGNRDRGNVFNVTTATTLQEQRFYMDFQTSTELYFFVYEGTQVNGDFFLIDQVYVPVSGTGEGWYTSGPISVYLQAGNYYYIGAAWVGEATYGRGSETVPLPCSFGFLETGNPAVTAGVPPATSCTTSYTGISPYYQTLVTGQALDWFWLDYYTGTVPAGGNLIIPGFFNSTGYLQGTVKTALLDIASNALNDPLLSLDVILTIDACSPQYTTGCSWGDGFTFFDIDNQVNNTTGCDELNGVGWSQYLQLPPAMLAAGQTYDFSMSTGYANNYATIWIDFNDDLIFTPDEIVLDCEHMVDANQVYAFQGTIPATADTGLHMMRARTNWNDCASDPCELYNYGETEDYMVNIQEFQGIGNLEGYVYEFGTNTPIEGATVAILNATMPWSAVTDINGYYFIQDIDEGNYDIEATHQDYCSQTVTGVGIQHTITTVQDFELAWAEIITYPEQIISAAIPENSQWQASLEITNNGNCDLVYEIELTEVAETFGGPTAKNSDLIYKGKEVPLEEFSNNNSLPALLTAGETDEGKPFVVNPYPVANNASEGEEIFGSDQNMYTAGPRFRGNFYECTTPTLLKEHRFWLNVQSAGTEMWFLVYENSTLSGDYTLISASDVTPQGPGGPGWYSSGNLSGVTMQAGMYYLIVAQFDLVCSYFNEQNISPYPIPASFGSLVSPCGWDWAPTPAFPPFNTVTVPTLQQAPVAYHQTLVTSTILDWFQLDYYSGTVAPGMTDTIPGTFNSTGYTAGTIKIADLMITSNAHPNKSATSLDVIMNVLDCTPIYSVGCSWGDGFTFFDIDNQINNSTGCDNLNGQGWSQYLGLPPAILEPGMTYDFNMSTGYSNNYATVWIDFNDDLNFTPDEMVIDCENMETVGQVFTFPGAIPANADTGIHLLRARTNWLNCADDPCIVYIYGEAEDYLVNIQDVPGTGVLEGYVYEFGTNVPVEGATVEILDGPIPWSTVTDIMGFYTMDGIAPGTYEVMASHPNYCSQIIAGVTVMESTTVQDFELQWAEIETNPEQLITATIPENSEWPTQLEITNNGSCDLIYDIQLTEVSETFGGPKPNTEDVVHTGTPLSMEEFFNLKTMVPKIIYPTVDDKGITPVFNSEPMTEDPDDMEEVFGSNANGFTAGPRSRGNYYECTSTTLLAEHRFYLDVAAATQMWFCVYEGAALEGVYNLISASDVSPQGPGSGWYSSGPVNVTMQTGSWYLIVSSFEEPCTYYYEAGISPYPIPASFGQLVEGAGYSFAPTANFPPDATQTINGTPGPQIAYYQTLVTQATLGWFQLDWYSGLFVS
ncbi:MAG: carboxypeptidase regulatory-like domain-containing protein, partial [Bacteroidales bacterium]|nr:carboxypeptidase regulatory-like domain-containing protein [Bacteroidales bacterium]